MKLILIACALLAACKVEPQMVTTTSTGTDNHEFVKVTQHRERVDIKFIYHPSIADVTASYPDAKPGYIVKGYAYYERRPCEVHIVDPRIHYMPETIGHEVAHCVFGAFHEPK